MCLNHEDRNEVLLSDEFSAWCVNTFWDSLLRDLRYILIVYWWSVIIGWMMPLAIVKDLNLFKYGRHCLLPSLVLFWSTSSTFNEWKKLSDTALSQQFPPQLMLWISPKYFIISLRLFKACWLPLSEGQIAGLSSAFVAKVPSAMHR